MTDFRAREAAGVPLGRWLAWVAGTRARSGLALDDPMPLAARALRRFRPRERTP
jgi:hypothetical protein